MKRRLIIVAVVVGVLVTTAPTSHAPTLAASPTVHLTDAEAFGGPAVTSSKAAGAAPYRFAVTVGGQVVRWNPCQTIHWQFARSGAPKGGLTTVKSAVARVAALTGTRWQYDGSVRSTPNSRWLPNSPSSVRPVLIGWTDARHSDLLRGRPASVLAVARTAYFTANIEGKDVAVTKAAVIALDRANKLPMSGAVSWRSTMLHELGHLMGLAHVGSRSQMMYPMLSRSLRDLQAGDRAGLRRVGRAAGCVDVGF